MSTTNAFDNSELSSVEQLKQSIEQLMECIRLERKKYNEYAIIKEIVLACTTEGCGLSPAVQSKVYDVLMTMKLDVLELSSNNTLLGLPSFSAPELTYEEEFQLRNVVQSGIIRKSCSIFKELDELGITYNDNMRSRNFLGLSKDDEVLFDFKRELNKLQQLYVLKLEELISVLDEIIKFKSQRLPDLANEKMNCYELKLKSFKLQSEMLNAKLRVSIFTETDCSLVAYQELIKDVQQQQVECKKEIEELENLKEMYKQVSCKQYSEILQKYLKYKMIVDKKKTLRENSL